MAQSVPGCRLDNEKSAEAVAVKWALNSLLLGFKSIGPRGRAGGLRLSPRLPIESCQKHRVIEPSSQPDSYTGTREETQFNM